MREDYRKTVELLLDIAPRVFSEPTFAMKGGTAINLFVRDFPRLSVDIDVVYLPIGNEREEALQEISEALSRVRGQINKMPDLKTTSPRNVGNEDITFNVTRGGYSVKVEVNIVFRGTIYPTRQAPLTEAAISEFRREAHVAILDPDELYGSKLVAAMDRQHPRDIFDVLTLFEHGGITQRMRRAFVVYVAGHNRPIGEILTPNPQPLEKLYLSDFAGMTTKDVSLSQLEEIRTTLFRDLPASLDNDERQFLHSLKKGEPEWARLNIENVERLPAVQWKLLNIRKLMDKNPKKHAEQLQMLKQKLAL